MGPLLIERAPAKINLALHVRGRRPDGYHAIESVFAFARDGDTLQARTADGLILRLSGSFGAGLAAEADNLVLRAARALACAAKVEPRALLTLDKRLPVASGVGGGSADAAATLRLLNRLWSLDWPIDRLLPIAAELGADVPACLIGRTLRAAGTGTDIEPIAAPRLSGRPLLLVNPGVALSTPDVFAGWDGVDRGPLPPGDDADAWRNGRNDLEPPAMALAPEIRPLLAILRQHAPGARMSGSGATCFAVFDNDTGRDAAAQAVRRALPRAWMLPTCLA